MKPINILLVEDNEGDIFLTTEAFAQGKFVSDVLVARDGQAAIDLLVSRQASNEGVPDLVLLDVNLPRRNGHEVLRFIKSHERLKHIPVIVLTTSSSESDILKSYQEHANCFITKPIDVEHFIRVIASIQNFWISIVRLP